MNNSAWILILGSNSDIAISVAKKYASNGFNLYLAARNIENTRKTASDLIIRYDIEVISLYFEANDYKSHVIFYDSLKIKPLGVVVSFGMLGDQKRAQDNFSLAQEIINTNYLAIVSILEIIASNFEDLKKGFIIVISSVAGDRGRASNYIYGSSKAGLSAYLSGLTHRLHRSNVDVMTVKPGFVKTKMTEEMDLPNFLTATPEEVSHLIFNSWKRKKNTLYVKPIWKYIMLVIKNIPNKIFYKTKL